MEKINVRKTLFTMEVGSVLKLDRTLYKLSSVRSNAALVTGDYMTMKYHVTTDGGLIVVTRLS
jgi:hypothetical protein